MIQSRTAPRCNHRSYHHGYPLHGLCKWCFSKESQRWNQLAAEPRESAYIHQIDGKGPCLWFRANDQVWDTIVDIDEDSLELRFYISDRYCELSFHQWAIDDDDSSFSGSLDLGWVL